MKNSLVCVLVSDSINNNNPLQMESEVKGKENEDLCIFSADTEGQMNCPRILQMFTNGTVRKNVEK